MRKPQIELLYLAYNRLEFTSLTWHLMMGNTNWDLVSKLTVYDDGSEDGTLEFLREHMEDCPVDRELRIGDFRSPPAVMNHFLATCEAPLFFKADSDIALPKNYLCDMKAVMDKHPKLILLGSEPGMGEKHDDTRSDYGVSFASHIGGVGLMRADWMQSFPPIPARGRFGFQDWQYRYDAKRAWITPDLLMPQLDRIPREPWMRLSKQYVENGWQREWPLMRPESEQYWGWFSEYAEK